MRMLKEKIQEYLIKHPMENGCNAENAMDFLYTAYTESHENDSPEIKKFYAQLDPILEAMPIEENNALFGIIVQLCCENERRGFIDGFCLCFQLINDLTQ